MLIVAKSTSRKFVYISSIFIKILENSSNDWICLHFASKVLQFQFFYRCSIDQSEPKPTFSWFIDDIELTDPKTFDAELSQTIELELTADRSNKTLKCLVNFGKTLPELEQSEVLNYVYDKDFKDTIIKPVIDVVTANAYPAIIAITIVVCFIVLTVGACYKCKIICFKRTVGTDAEKGEKVKKNREILKFSSKM